MPKVQVIVSLDTELLSDVAAAAVEEKQTLDAYIAEALAATLEDGESDEGDGDEEDSDSD